jgi:hypothetical protein
VLVHVGEIAGMEGVLIVQRLTLRAQPPRTGGITI